MRLIPLQQTSSGLYCGAGSGQLGRFRTQPPPASRIRRDFFFSTHKSLWTPVSMNFPPLTNNQSTPKVSKVLEPCFSSSHAAVNTVAQQPGSDQEDLLLLERLARNLQGWPWGLLTRAAEGLTGMSEILTPWGRQPEKRAVRVQAGELSSFLPLLWGRDGWQEGSWWVGVCPHVWDLSRTRAGFTQAPGHMGQTSESSQSTVLRTDLAHKHILLSFCCVLLCFFNCGENMHSVNFPALPVFKYPVHWHEMQSHLVWPSPPFIARTLPSSLIAALSTHWPLFPLPQPLETSFLLSCLYDIDDSRDLIQVESHRVFFLFETGLFQLAWGPQVSSML